MRGHTNLDSSAPIIPLDFNGTEVRAVTIDNEPHLVGKDVAEALGYADPTTALRSDCRGVQKLHPIADRLGHMQEKRLLSEPDVLRLIVNSSLPSAELFERWVFEDVLPTIRKTGGYYLPATFPEALRMLADQAEVNERLRLTVQLQSPGCAGIDTTSALIVHARCS